MRKPVKHLGGGPLLWVMERLNMDGEELPVVRHAETWLPAPAALSYVLRTRFGVGPAQLVADMRAVALVYNWSEGVAGVGDFEAFLAAGNFLSEDQLRHLARYLEWRHDAPAGEDYLVADQTYNVRLFAVQQFLKWAYEPTNRGGRAAPNQDQVTLQTTKMFYALEEEKVAVGDSPWREPLATETVKLIRRAIGPDRFGVFPPDVFAENTRYRNWLMFEMDLNLGTRKGELLTLKVEHLSMGRSPAQIFVPRQQDAAEDPRTRRRLRGKTTERLVPLMDPELLPVIVKYRDEGPPVGRNNPSHKSPYLFLTGGGQPVSNSTADYIIKQIKTYALRLLDSDGAVDEGTRQRLREDLLDLSWHRLRHTWAVNAARTLYRKHEEGAWEILRQRGGWRTEVSMERYIKYARREIADDASVDYLSERALSGGADGNAAEQSRSARA